MPNALAKHAAASPLINPMTMTVDRPAAAIAAFGSITAANPP